MTMTDSAIDVNRILIVEEETETSSMLCECLAGAGYETVKTDSSKALAYIRKNRVDMVLLGLSLRDNDGMRLTQVIKEQLGSEEFVPVIVLSFKESESERAKEIAFADEYITKPCSGTEVLVRVKAMFRIRQLQQELVKSRNRYRFLYRNMPEMCVSIDSENRILDCNNAFTGIMRISEEQIAGRKLSDFFIPEERKLIESLASDLEKNGSISPENIFHMDIHGTEDGQIFVRLTGTSFGPQNSGLVAVLVLQDITRYLRNEERQINARRQLYRSAHLVSIGTLASGVAHELNNPLAAVLGFTDALLHRFEDGGVTDQEETEQYLGIIKKETLRCRDIIDNLHKFSRDREPQIRDISLFSCIQSACMLLVSKCGKKQIKIVNNIPEDVIIKADPQRIGQVFLHVFSNAIDFSPENSRVEISRKAGMKENKYIQIHIVDYGCGIAPEVLPFIFDPFFTTKKVGQGIGIGLSLCHKAMEECEGVIDVVSRKGEGATVILEIPAGNAASV
jgi:PAS domain S-box-containing protein